jgi:hypothetical protein
MRWYFSRPTSDTNTEFETIIRRHFCMLHLENPNAHLHQIGYSSMGIDYLFFAIAMLPAYDACIALELPNGMWSNGVSREVNWFHKNRRPVFKLCYDQTPDYEWTFHLKLLSEPIGECCTVEQTRALVHYYQSRPLGGRSHADHCERLHAPSWTELGLPEPQRTEHPPLY